MTTASRAAGLAALALLLVAGCATDGRPRPHYPDPHSLDAGAYGVEPLDVPENGNERYGRVLESVRMMEALADPVEIDPALTHGASATQATPLPTPATASVLLASPVRAVLEREKMLAGAEVDGTDVAPTGHGPVIGSARILTTMVLRFPDDDAARRAAKDIDAVDAAVSPDNVGVPVPGHLAAHAHWRPAVPTLAATLAEGPYVISLLVGHTTTDLNALNTLAAKAFAAQVPRLREFAATPADRLATLPLDPDGMVRRMVPDAPRRWSYPAVTVLSQDVNAGWNASVLGHGVVYGPRAAWLAGSRKKHDHPIELRASNGFNVVDRFADAAAARRAFEAATRKDRESGDMVPVPPSAGAVDTACWESLQPDELRQARFLCRVVYGRYTAALVARELTTAQQKIAAQYGLLVNGG
ncbi:DUF7373 family lipoprotein [Nocardia blacklockiae]|uniref:DUF7373 family lipoprotein n=1 Tax=Nocardia blacklockiae TaxID=480036 RepID=UPI001893CC4D|nr:hypothetical protein [Nocardia blacklockiae]MBF6170494.1 hypothetical protein [Nocardia blacklockiae]